MADKPKLVLKIPFDNLRKWHGIVWHHSATSDGITNDWNVIWKYHTSYRIDGNIVSESEFNRRFAIKDGKVFEKPWKAIGYHVGTEWVDGKLVFHWGRPLSMSGAHAGVKNCSNQFNEDYLGFCAIGNFDLKPPEPEHWEFNLMLTRAFMEQLRIPVSHVIGHCEVFDKFGVPRQKTCPGRCWDMELFRSEL